MIPRGTRTTLLVMAAVLFGAARPTAAHAEENKSGAVPFVCPICHTANNQTAPYAQKAGFTLVRGAANAALGWTELLVQPTAEVKNNGNLLMGLGKGVGFAITRTGAGIGELFTFWVPRSKEGYLSLTKDCPICLKAASAAGTPAAPPEASKPQPR